MKVIKAGDFILIKKRETQSLQWMDDHVWMVEEVFAKNKIKITITDKCHKPYVLRIWPSEYRKVS